MLGRGDVVGGGLAHGGGEERVHEAAWEGVDAAAGDVLGHHVDGDVEVDNGDAAHEHGEG